MFSQLMGPEGWFSALNLALLGRLLLAAVLGGFIGFEREVSGKPAGLRTNLLICVGAALLTELSIGVAAFANEENVAQGVPFRADPARIAAQIVSGIGFLGAGTILQARGNVIGLTTAATIWVVAAIGMAVGAGAYVEAVGATILVYISLAVLARLESSVVRRWGRHRYIILMDPDPSLMNRVDGFFRAHELRVESSSLEKGHERYEATLHASGRPEAHEALLRDLVEQAGVQRVTRAV